MPTTGERNTFIVSFSAVGQEIILHGDNLGQLRHTQEEEWGDFSLLSFIQHETSSRRDLY